MASKFTYKAHSTDGVKAEGDQEEHSPKAQAVFRCTCPTHLLYPGSPLPHAPGLLEGPLLCTPCTHYFGPAS